MMNYYFGRKLKLFFVSSIIIITCSFFHSNDHIKNYNNITRNIKKLVIISDNSASLADSAFIPEKLKQLRANYFVSRHYYKQIEFLIEYCAPFDVKYFINGPLVKKSDIEIGSRIVDPHGFQVVEELLFGTDTIDTKLLKTELLLLKNSFKTFEYKLNDIQLNDSQLLEAMQFELIRIASLTLNGYDATYTKRNVNECKSVFTGLEIMINDIKKANSINNYPVKKHIELITKLKAAQTYCSLHPSYNSFNRLYFITRYIKPAYALLVNIHRHDAFPYTPVNYAIDLKNENIFETGSYNINYFSVQEVDTFKNTLQAKLGELLFFDPVLSGNNQRACASCHKPDLAFSDGLQKGMDYERNTLSRNTPSLLNASLQKQFFYDGRARQLEQQANDVLHSQKEMNSSIDEMIRRLNQSKEYKSLFVNAFRDSPDTVISYYGILKAISEYEKTLVSMNSRFDQYIKGNYKQLSVKEINGYNVFSGKAQCGSCHFFPLFSGLVPPVYNDTEYEVIGVPQDTGHKFIDEDQGRIVVSRSHIHRYAFKTPGIRNSSLTAPYMHNGIYKTLDEVIEFYNKGGGQGLGINIPHQTLPFDSLQLTKKEMNDIKAFIISLTDTVGLIRKPQRLPLFDDATLNKRAIGGIY